MRENTPLQTELERRILRGLACEYDEALHFLEERLRLRMTRPLFRLEDLKGRWGQWMAEHREIRFSRDLVLRYPWGAVREVLRHEMAHQLAGIISPDHHRPHGAAFREACRLLRADPAASAGYQVLDPLAASAASAPEDRLRLRVQKLFALAESPNPHEAASAMRKARELMTRYGVDATNRSWSGPHLSILIGAAALRHYRDDYLLAHLLTDLYEVAGVWVPAYVLTKGRMGSALEISGRPAQVQVAAYAHDFVRRFIEDGWRREPIRHKNGKRSRRDFAVGVIQGFRDRVIPSRSVKLADQTCLKALVPVPDSGLAAYLQHRYPRLRHFRREGACVDPDAYAAGLDRGRSMVIHQGVTDSATLPRALPERASMGARPSEEG